MVATIAAAVITLLGATIAMLRIAPKDDVVLNFDPKDPSLPAKRLLFGFSLVTIIFGVLTLIRYRAFIIAQADQAFFLVWLALTMIAGMFIQIIAANYRAGNPLFFVAPSRLIYPLLFSVIVFYPIWALAASAPKNFFVIHAAFLNGYFWESVVSSAHAPDTTGR